MSVDLSNILAGLEAKITAMDSNTPLDDMILNLKSYQEAGGKFAAIYDSAGTLPAADSDYTGMMVYANNALYMFNGNRWDEADSDTVIDPTPAWVFQGSSYGYHTGGYLAPLSPTQDNEIEKYSFVSDGNSVDVGDMTVARSQHASASSSTTGFITQGYDNVADTTTLESFPFAADVNATQVADFDFSSAPVGTQAAIATRDGSWTSERGYIVGGYIGGTSNLHDISHYDYASYTFADEVADLFQRHWNGAGNSSSISGYKSGGLTAPTTRIDVIQKFQFASLATATDVGNLINAKSDHGTASSSDYAFLAGGRSPNIADIQKFPFASDTDAADTGGDLVAVKYQLSGTSETDYGYMAGGAPAVNTIEKFPYNISSGTTTDVGDLTATYGSGGSNQI